MFSKKAIQKIAETIGDLVENMTTEQITKASSKSTHKDKKIPEKYQSQQEYQGKMHTTSNAITIH